MEFLNKKQKLILALIGSVMIIFIGYYIFSKTTDSQYIEFEEDIIDEKEDNIQNKEEIIVHITGEVENEGVIKIDDDSRLIDVIEKAGGITDEADLSKINLAYPVKDGQKIYIPNTNEDVKEEYITEEAGEDILPEDNKKQEKVNINTAKQTELETLSGIGPSTALKIIDYREKNGKFKEINDLKNVPGIGESKFEAIKEDICV